MIWSKYNYLYRSERTGRWILYNSVSGALIALSDGSYRELTSLKDNPELLECYSNANELIDSKIFVNKDSTAINTKKLKVIEKRLSRDAFDLTIAPILACNFRCTYCFQDNLPKRLMSETTEDNVIRFLKRMKREAALLRITWFGGEPLLALKRMKSFCEKSMRRNRHYFRI